MSTCNLNFAQLYRSRNWTFLRLVPTLDHRSTGFPKTVFSSSGTTSRFVFYLSLCSFCFLFHLFILFRCGGKKNQIFKKIGCNSGRYSYLPSCGWLKKVGGCRQKSYIEYFFQHVLQSLSPSWPKKWKRTLKMGAQKSCHFPHCQ